MIAIASIAAQAQNTLSIKITELEANTGTVYISLMDANEKQVQQAKGTVSDGVCTVKFSNVEQGKYAVTYYHDANDNGKLDTGMFGKPVEGYGYSNDARGFMGPADFEDQIFEIESDLQITLKTIN
jgi:uncharacterized protein (DUF2141 family)